MAIQEVLETGWLTQGPRAQSFERTFAERHNVPFALATTSCTTAMQLALAALDIGPDDEVIVPAFTWVATANVVVRCGATPVFADVDGDTFNIRPSAIVDAITPKTKAVIIVHLFGLCADVDAIRAAVPDNIALIEDAACAAGSAYHDRPAGGLGDIGCFSFHARKVITTGEGGMVTTANPALARRMEMLRNHGASISPETRTRGTRPFELPDFPEAGFNFRMSDLLAAIGEIQLSKLDAFIEQRRRIADMYQERLCGIRWLSLPKEPDGYRHSWQSFVCRLKADATSLARNEILQRLEDRGVGARPGTLAVPRVDFFRRQCMYDESDFPIAFACADDSIAIPIHNCMTEDDVDYVIKTLQGLDNI